MNLKGLDSISLLQFGIIHLHHLQSRARGLNDPDANAIEQVMEELAARATELEAGPDWQQKIAHSRAERNNEMTKLKGGRV